MKTTITAKELRASLPKVVAQVRQGARFTVMYRSRAAFEIAPINEPSPDRIPLADDSLYGADAVGRSTDGGSAAKHDLALYE